MEIEKATGNVQPIQSRRWRTILNFAWLPDGSGFEDGGVAVPDKTQGSRSFSDEASLERPHIFGEITNAKSMTSCDSEFMDL